MAKVSWQSRRSSESFCPYCSCRRCCFWSKKPKIPRLPPTCTFRWRRVYVHLNLDTYSLRPEVIRVIYEHCHGHHNSDSTGSLLGRAETSDAPTGQNLTPAQSSLAGAGSQKDRRPWRRRGHSAPEIRKITAAACFYQLLIGIRLGSTAFDSANAWIFAKWVMKWAISRDSNRVVLIRSTLNYRENLYSATASLIVYFQFTLGMKTL